MEKTKVICFANNKGGSGKSTTCANVGYSLAALGKKVLLVDGDMQMNLSLSFFPEEEVLSMASGKKNLYEAIKKQKDLTGCIHSTKYEGVDLIPSSMLMSGIEYELFGRKKREISFRKCLKPVRESGIYDYILVDAPPTLGGWVMNLLCASDQVIIPVEASPWGLFGLANLFEFLNDGKKYAQELSVMGIVLTKVNARKNYFKQTMETLQQLDGIRVFEHYIRIDSAIEWAQDESCPVMAYKRSARSAVEYLELTKEVLQYASW